jgi:hypothetical protein
MSIETRLLSMAYLQSKLVHLQTLYQHANNQMLDASVEAEVYREEHVAQLDAPEGPHMVHVTQYRRLLTTVKEFKDALDSIVDDSSRTLLEIEKLADVDT